LGETRNDLAGSQWAYLHGQRGGQSPTADLHHEMRLIELLLDGQDIFEAAHDVSQGGLAATLVEMVLRNKVGAYISLSGEALVSLMSETPGRVVVAVDSANTSTLGVLANKHQIRLTKIGITGGDALSLNEASISLVELKSAFTTTIPQLFGQ
ncbi:MAG: phosphoribosylformylglycinamidine synthase II, partial [Actinobacteria bacterium]|nr:phosphoribosylformylglycinamidine synthase II [Actinomycetota bacterium]